MYARGPMLSPFHPVPASISSPLLPAYLELNRDSLTYGKHHQNLGPYRHR